MDRVINFRRPPAKNQNSKLSFISKLFFCLDIIQVIVVGSIQIAMMVIGDYRPIKDGGMGLGRRLYMVVFTCCVIYTCLLCLFAIRLQNFLEIVAFVFQNYLFMAYSFVQVYHLHLKTKYSIPVRFKNNPVIHALVVVNSIYLVLMNVVFTILAVKLFQEYGWKIYKKVRFNVNLRGAYHMYELVLCLMKMNLLVLAMFSICYNQTVLRNMQTAPLFTITIAAIPFAIILGFVGYFGIRKENKVLTVMFTVSIFIAMGCYMFAIYKVGKLTCFGCMPYFKTFVDLPREVVVHLAYLATVALIFSLALCIATIKAFCNFGKGLRNHFAMSNRHGGMVTLSLGITRNLNDIFRSIPNDNCTVANDETNSSITMVQFNQHCSPVANDNQLCTTGETEYDNLSVNNITGTTNDTSNYLRTQDDTSSDKGTKKTNNLDHQIRDYRDSVTQNEFKSSKQPISNTSNSEITKGNTSNHHQVHEYNSPSDKTGASVNLSKRGSIAEQQHQPQVNVLTKVYDETLKRINNFYTTGRRHLKISNSIARSKITKYSNSHIPVFSAETILSNNGICMEVPRGRKVGGIPVSIAFGDIESDVITNMIVSNASGISLVETSYKEERTSKKRSMGYKYSRSELFTEDNVIPEEDEDDDFVVI